MKFTKAQNIRHTKFVESTMRNSEPNRLLHAIPSVTPEEVRGEDSPEKKENSSQMGSSYWPLLVDFKNKINSEEPDTCRKCHKERETAAHVVECIGRIKCEDLWRSPEESVSRLGEILALTTTEFVLEIRVNFELTNQLLHHSTIPLSIGFSRTYRNIKFFSLLSNEF